MQIYDNKKKKIQRGGLVQAFTHPDLNDLGTSTQNFFTGVHPRVTDTWFDVTGARRNFQCQPASPAPPTHAQKTHKTR